MPDTKKPTGLFRYAHALWALALLLLSSSAIAQAINYSTSFESADSYTTASLNSQNGWTASGATVISSGAFDGTNAVSIPGASVVGTISKVIASSPSTGVVYFDFYLKPVAETTLTNSTLVNADGGQIGFLVQDGAAVTQALDGDAAGGGTWLNPIPALSLAVSGGNQTSSWHRFTIRKDYGTSAWDLFVDGELVEYGLGLKNPTGTDINFSVAGNASTETGFDYLYAGDINPLFEDTANEGIPDSWKTQFGIPAATAIRNLSPNSTGVPYIEYYRNGQNPLDSFVGRALAESSPASSNTITYTYDASGRLTNADFNSLAKESFTLDAATNLTSVTATVQPIVAWRDSFGLPVDGTGNGADTASPAGDSLPNLAKYALGLSPLVPATGSYPTVTLVSTGGSSYLAVSYQRPDPAPADLTYTVEVSSNGTSWSSGSSVTDAVSTTVTGGTATVVVRDKTPVSTPIYGRYIRLSIARTNLSL